MRAQNWVPFGQVHASGDEEAGKFDVGPVCGRLDRRSSEPFGRAQVIKGTVQDKGKRLYQIRIENASPLILNGIALLGDGERGGGETRRAAGNLGFAAQKLDGPRHRRRRQVARV